MSEDWDFRRGDDAPDWATVTIPVIAETEDQIAEVLRVAEGFAAKSRVAITQPDETKGSGVNVHFEDSDAARRFQKDFVFTWEFDRIEDSPA